MSEPHLLVVDDARDIRDPLGAYLRRQGFRISLAADAAVARKLLATSAIDLVILDVMMPGESGLSLCRSVRENYDIPIILLTAMAERTDRIVGLEIGADDYVTKPFDPRELLARIRNVLRRTAALPPQRDNARARRLVFDRWIFDPNGRELIDDAGTVVPLSTGEARLLTALTLRPHVVLSRDQLLDLTSGRAAQAFERSVDNQISRLRRKLERDPDAAQDSVGRRLRLCGRCGGTGVRLPAPRSLASQLILLLVVAVLAAQIPVAAIFATKSTKIGRAAFATHIGERVAVLVHVLNVLPPELVPQAVAAYSIPVSRFAIDADASIADRVMDADDEEIAGLLMRRLRVDADRVRVQLVDDPQALARYLPWRATPKTLLMSVRLASGRWLNTQARIIQPDAPIWLQIGLVQCAAAIVAILVTLGLGLRHIIRPVMALANAAAQVGSGMAVAPLPERGSRELQTMTASFNTMQARLRAFVEDRTRMLAAISHDLRTPLSSLWLRAEMVEDAELRDAMVRTVAEMKVMVEATLAFARDDATQESGPVDLAELAGRLVEDQRALGCDVSFSGPASAPFHGRALALRRALDNLVGNAVRYGVRARLTLSSEPEAVRIRIDDDGPGLPPDRMEDMFLPFVRLDVSRNAQTGGTGLGLAIARSAIREHGGNLVLSNLPVRGLRAEITFPLGGYRPVADDPRAETLLSIG